MYTLNNKNVLIDIISKTSTSDVIVQSINAINSTDDYMFDIMISVENKEKLFKFINAIESLENVKKVERLIK